MQIKTTGQTFNNKFLNDVLCLKSHISCLVLFSILFPLLLKYIDFIFK